MSFQGSLAGWQWALAACVPLGIFALYFLRLKRKPIEVPSTFLWKKSIEDLRVNALWQRLRKNILLLLQLLVCAWVLMSLTRPTMESTASGRRLIILIDNSASMSATDIRPNRLADAKIKANAIVATMQSGDATMVIATSDVARVVSSYTENTADLKARIASIETTARRTNLREALTIASGLANPQRAGEEDAEAVPASLYLISDGRFPEIADIPLGNLNLTYLSVGTSNHNLAITGLAARPNDADPTKLAVFAKVQNFSDRPITTEARLLVDNKPIDLQRLTVGPGSEQPMSFRLSTPQSAVLSVDLQAADDLAVDNRAWAVINPPRRVRMLVVGADNPILKAVLKTEQLAKLATIEFESAKFADSDFERDQRFANFDLIVFDRCSPKTMPPCNTFFIRSLPPTLKDAKPINAEGPIVLNWKAEHPVLRYLSIDDVNVVSASIVTAPRGADTLIESDKGPLLFAQPRGIYTDLIQTFALVDDSGSWKTDWPLKLSFPLYIINVVRALGNADSEGQQNLHPGDPIAYRSPEDVAVATVEYPSGKKAEIKRSPGGRFEVLDTEEVGIYTISAGKSERRYAVNLFDFEESNIRPAEQVKIGAVAAKDASAEFVTKRELWKPLALVALLFLLFEWYVYNRRVYI